MPKILENNLKIKIIKICKDPASIAKITHICPQIALKYVKYAQNRGKFTNIKPIRGYFGTKEGIFTTLKEILRELNKSLYF